MFVNTEINCVEMAAGQAGGVAVDVIEEVCSRMGGALSFCWGQARIHAARPCRINSANPQAPLADHVPLNAARRRSS